MEEGIALNLGSQRRYTLDLYFDFYEESWGLDFHESDVQEYKVLWLLQVTDILGNLLSVKMES